MDDVPANVLTLKSEQSLVLPTLRGLPGGQEVDEYTWLKSDEPKFVKDSKEFTDRDLENLAYIIKSSDHKFIIITHGTDWMAQNATTLAKHLEGSGKVVAFTGSMVPLSVRSKTSDGIAGLTFTMEHITEKNPGVYVVRHEIHSKRLKFFDPTTVEKDFLTSRDVANQGRDQRLMFKEKSSETSR